MKNRTHPIANQRGIKIAIYFFLYLSLATLTIGCAISTRPMVDESQYYSTWKLNHSGKYQLTWYYKTRSDFENNQPTKVVVHDKVFDTHPGVRPPTINGLYMLENSWVREGEEILDIGTGTGLHAIFYANKAKQIVATDIYAPAVENAQINAQLNHVEDKIDFRVGDLFEPIKDDEKFDVFFFNINLPFAVGNKEKNELHERFFSEVHKYMKPDARIFYQTSFVINLPYILDMLERNNFRIIEIHAEPIGSPSHQPLFLEVKRNTN